MKKKAVPERLLDLKCPRCGKVTHHYLNSETGEYKCVICQAVNKTIKVEPKKVVVFEADPELDAALNPDAQADETFDNVSTEVETADGEILDDNGNPV